ncbi:MAG TPA: hypothetical protein VGG64_11855 [Pirellulales bacterium]
MQLLRETLKLSPNLSERRQKQTRIMGLQTGGIANPRAEFLPNLSQEFFYGSALFALARSLLTKPSRPVPAVVGFLHR